MPSSESNSNLRYETLFESLSFPRGAAMPNLFMLAPLTNLQSNEDGTLSEEEYRWLTMRADGGFGSTMTCAANVQAIGQGFEGQLGAYDDKHVEGLTRLAAAINETGSQSLVQLHHAGNRAPADLIGTTPVCPSDDPETGARALTEDEVQELIAAFIAGAKRCETAGFDGVELHGAHGYILCEFLSSETNHRQDSYGGSLQNRSRLLFEIIDGIRSECGPDFVLGVRLSPERFGMDLGEIREVSQQLIDSGVVDFLDLSLWDCFKEPNDQKWKGQTLTEATTSLERRLDPNGRRIPIGVAGKIHDPQDALKVIELGADFPILGRVAILHHDYPNQLRDNADFVPLRVPVTSAHLAAEGLSPKFISYMDNWKGFVSDGARATSTQR